MRFFIDLAEPLFFVELDLAGEPLFFIDLAGEPLFFVELDLAGEPLFFVETIAEPLFFVETIAARLGGQPRALVPPRQKAERRLTIPPSKPVRTRGYIRGRG